MQHAASQQTEESETIHAVSIIADNETIRSSSDSAGC